MRSKRVQSKESIFTSELTQRLLPETMTFKPKRIEQSGFMCRTLLVKNFSVTIETEFILTSVAQIKNTTFSMRLVPIEKNSQPANSTRDLLLYAGSGG